MKTLTDEIKEKNYATFISKLNKLGIDTELLDKEIGTKLKNAPYSTDNKLTESAYDGALIDIVLKTLTVYAVKLNGLLKDENKQMDINTLVKVCLLHQLSKCETIIPNDNEWEKTNKGILYKFAPNTVALKMGLKSVLLCQRLGITFTDEEVEAMTIMDRDDSDNQAKYFSHVLSRLVKTANELTYIDICNK